MYSFKKNTLPTIPKQTFDESIGISRLSILMFKFKSIEK